MSFSSTNCATATSMNSPFEKPASESLLTLLSQGFAYQTNEAVTHDAAPALVLPRPQAMQPEDERMRGGAGGNNQDIRHGEEPLSLSTILGSALDLMEDDDDDFLTRESTQRYAAHNNMAQEGSSVRRSNPGTRGNFDSRAEQ